MISRLSISKLICERFNSCGLATLEAQYKSSGNINYFIVDNLLPSNLADEIDNCFPPHSQLNLLDGPQERKYVGVRFNNEQSLVEECVYAFQQDEVIDLISQVCGIPQLLGDQELYAGAGVSSMSEGCFLNPHIDNSHDRLKRHFRRLNLLYYVSRELTTCDGGNLLLYPHGISKSAISIPPIFNRLVVFRTDNRSLHAVSKITSPLAFRKTISNYYFSESSPLGRDYYHSTSFRAFSNESRRKDLSLRLGSFTRTFLKAISGNIIGKYFNTGLHRGGRKSAITNVNDQN